MPFWITAILCTAPTSEGVADYIVVTHAQPAGAQMPNTVVLSPHLDDAVLSAWHALTGPFHAQLVTVFAGVPEPGFLTPLDRRHGVTDSAALVHRRRAEDQSAVSRSGCRSIQLDLPDVQYRAHRVEAMRREIARDPAAFVRIVGSRPQLRLGAAALHQHLAAFAAGSDQLYASAGIGGHPDHRDVAEYAVTLARSGVRVRLYADVPYVFRHGAPSWLGPTSDDSDRAADDYVQAALAPLDLTGLTVTRTVTDLPSESVRAKLAAVSAYAPELPGLCDHYPGFLRRLGREAYWQLDRRPA